jgi:hypothetical protein
MKWYERMIVWSEFEKAGAEVVVAYLKVLSWHFPGGGTKENKKKKKLRAVGVPVRFEQATPKYSQKHYYLSQLGLFCKRKCSNVKHQLFSY